MSAIFKFLFERATDPLGLPINALYEYIILAVIGAVAYGLAYPVLIDIFGYDRTVVVVEVSTTETAAQSSLYYIRSLSL